MVLSENVLLQVGPATWKRFRRAVLSESVKLGQVRTAFVSGFSIELMSP